MPLQTNSEGVQVTGVYDALSGLIPLTGLIPERLPWAIRFRPRWGFQTTDTILGYYGLNERYVHPRS